MPRYLTDRNVFEAAEARLDWLYSEFDPVVVATSGGKDSTVVLNLAIRAAERAGRLPVKTFFLDEEIIWDATVEHIRVVREDPRVDLEWVQIPIWYDNNSSEEGYWTRIWDPEKRDVWVRDQEPGSIRCNPTNIEYYYEFLSAYNRLLTGDSGVTLLGLRAEESPMRTRRLLGSSNVYKWITWHSGGTLDRKTGVVRARQMFPIYDWRWQDVWKAIHENGWEYCHLYDLFWQRSVPIPQMRVSALSHVESMNQIHLIQELEPDTWERLQRRLPGLNASQHLDLVRLAPKKLPAAYATWREYRDDLLPKLVSEQEHLEGFHQVFARGDPVFVDTPWQDYWYWDCISAIILNDYNPKEGRLVKRIASMRSKALAWRRREERGVAAVA